MNIQKTAHSPLLIITGALGFIGSAVVKQLNDQKKENLLLVDDIKMTEKWKNLAGKKFLHIISKHDLFEFLKHNRSAIEGIIHLGACSDTMMMDGDYLMKNNYEYTLKLAEYALERDIRFIYASSAATYGDGKLGFSDDLDSIDELQPLNLYGLSKHLFDLWAKRQGVFNQIVGLKYFNVFGPNENHKGAMASMVFKMFPKVQTQGVVHLFRSTDPERFPHGGQQRDFIYVKDVAEMTCRFLENTHSGLFNIGLGKPTSWNELAACLFKATGKSEKIEYVEMPETLKKQYQNYTCANMDKYLKIHGMQLGDLPGKFSIEQAVKDYVQNYLVKDERW